MRLVAPHRDNSASDGTSDRFLTETPIPSRNSRVNLWQQLTHSQKCWTEWLLVTSRPALCVFRKRKNRPSPQANGARHCGFAQTENMHIFSSGGWSSANLAST